MKRKFLILSFVLLGLLTLGKGVLAESDMCPFDHEMGLGSESTAVKELQQFLNLDKSVYNGPFTGYYGPLTQKAVMTFQEKAGLLANGKIDLATATVLCQIYISYKASEPINSDNSLEADSGCFLSTLNLEMGTYKNTNEEVLKLQK
jgi:N-acetylmuramoyl-L-alanine amidase